MKKWEYQTIELNDETEADHLLTSWEKDLDRLGQDGWQLVSVIEIQGAPWPVAFLKREI